jgi:hypothetical protein
VLSRYGTAAHPDISPPSLITLRDIAAQAHSPEAIMLLSAEADQHEEDADLLERGGNKPGEEVLGPTKLPARL